MTATDDDAASHALIDLRDKLLPVGDQGRRGTCVAFALTAVHEAERGVATDLGALEDLAEEVLYWGAKQIDGNRDNGTRFTSANDALQRWGQPAEALWPYEEARDQRAPTYSPPDDAIDARHCHRAALRAVSLDVTAVRTELAAGRPVALGIPVWDGFRRAEAEPLPAPTLAQTYPTRHAVVAVGYDPGRNAMLIRNSWGEGWGDAGHLWVDAAMLQMATGAWIIDNAASEAQLPTDNEHEEVLE
jgi:C1A family cysteine protease